ncbi:MAG: GNAT family N-acetyltransferase, partial [Candidatus Geothermincolia bacterium]
MGNDAALAIRNMTRSELDWALDLTSAEGWNPGLHDAECFFEVDPGGFFLATAGGSPVGCVSAVIYDDGYGFGGLYVVVEEWRARGVGRLLAQAAFERMAGRNIGQDAVTSMREQYESMGFEVAFTSSRYEGIAAGGSAIRASLVDVADVEFEKLADFDREFVPAPRDRFLARWVVMPDSTCLVCVEDGRIKGYGVLRKCLSGHKLGPLFARDTGTAELLLDALSSRVAGEAIYLDVPRPNAPGNSLAVAR